jgi:competence protein ComEA
LVLAFLLNPFYGILGNLASPVALEAAKASRISEPVNLNQAGLEELTQLKGIGPKTAQRILDYRKEHGAFKSVEDLVNVKGIGGKKLGKIRDQVKL